MLRCLAALLATVVLVGGCGVSAPTASPLPSPSAGTSGPSGSPVTASPTVSCAPVVAPPSDWWTGRTWYEVFVRSFADADGDGIGDLRGLTARLDYLDDGDPATTSDLGVGGLWLMPIAEAASYHGYDVTDYRAVERDYGTLTDLRALLAAAHARGLRVIVDFVPNHTSSDHPWFRDALTPGSAHDDWYVWSAERPAWAGPAGGPAWHEAAGRWYYGVFWEGMPDLDLTNQAVTAELRSIARYWLDEVGVDGFRVDAAKHLIETGPDAQTNTPETLAWLAGFRSSIRDGGADPLLVGEVWEIAAIAGRYVPESLDMTFDFGLAEGIRLALRNGRAGPLRTALLDSLRWWPPNRNATFLANHDQNRIMSELGGDRAAARLAAFLLLTLPGVPFLYYGEELGLEGRKPDERIRTPFPWTEERPGAGFTTGTPWEPLAEVPPGTSVAAQTGDPASLLSTYRTLVRARADDPALRAGGTVLVETGSEEVGAWLRTSGEGISLVVANLSDAPVADYGLSVGEGPLCGPVVPRVVASVGLDGEPAVAAPVAAPSGGFEGYRPLPALPPRSGLVIALDPAP